MIETGFMRYNVQPVGRAKKARENGRLSQIAFMNIIAFKAVVQHLRSAHTRKLVPATSPCDKSLGQVPSCEVAIFALKSSRRDQSLVPATSPSNSNWFEFLFMRQVPETSPFV